MHIRRTDAPEIDSPRGRVERRGAARWTPCHVRRMVSEMCWHVLLVGGPSGVGKTELTRALARRHDANVSEIDDIYATVRCVTSEATLPALHARWDPGESAEQTVRRHLAVCRELAPAVEAVIGCHLDFGPRVIVEGDYLLPASANRGRYGGELAGDRVRAVFLTDDEPLIAANLQRREPAAGPQPGRARISHLLGEALRRECEIERVPVVRATPWGDLAGRVSSALSR
jgi:2-phosphoglycerate kinase